jgi:single-strand DNA-binding protein
VNGIQTTVVGNVAGDIELRFSAAGNAWANFRVAVNRVTGPANDRKESTVFVGVKVFGDFAENVASSITKGTRVVVTGHFEEETWEDKETKAQRSKLVLIADEIAPSLRWATASVSRTERKNTNAGPTSNDRSPAMSGAFDSNPFA